MMKKKSIREKFEDITLNVIEVGARGGPSTEFNKFPEIINYYGFEPEKEELEKLKHREKRTKFNNETYLPYFIGENDKDCSFNVYSSKGCSSLLEADLEKARKFSRDHYYELIEKIKVITTSLDYLYNNSKLPKITDILKIDTQGSELDIFTNAERVLKNVKAIRVEVSFVPIYKNQPLFCDVNNFLSKRDFSFQGFTEMHKWNHLISKKKHIKKSLKCIPKTQSSLIHADALFFNFNEKTCNEKNKKKDIMKNILICILYGFYDKAYFLAQKEDLLKYRNVDILKFISLKSKKDFLNNKFMISKILNKINRIL